MAVPFNEQQCFFIVALGFMVVGFQRGWRRELVSLVFVLLAAFLIRPDSGGGFLQFVQQRLPGTLSYLVTGTAAAAANGAPQQQATLGPWGPLLAFMIAGGIGYFVGNKAFPKPATPHERIIGVIPAIISAAVVLAYLGAFIPDKQNKLLSFTFKAPDPGQFVAIIFVVAVAAAIIALIAARAKKPAPKK